MRKLVVVVTVGLFLLVPLLFPQPLPASAKTDKAFNTGFIQFSDKPGLIEVALVPRMEVTGLNETTAADLHVRTGITTGPLHIAVSATGATVPLGPAALDL